MGTRSTFKGYLRSQGVDGGSKRPPNAASIGVMPIVVHVTVDAADSAATLTGEALPKGAVVTGVQVVSGHTGGASPLLDIGLGADGDALVDGIVADGDISTLIGAGATAGVDMGVELAATTEISAGTGGGTPGTGTSEVYITYVMADDGTFAN